MWNGYLAKLLMSCGPAGTAVITGSLTLAFLRHENPPTSGHLVAAIVIGLPIVFLVAATITLPASGRSAARLLILQLIATMAALGALVSQRTQPPVRAWLLAFFLLGLPIVCTALFFRWLQRVTVGASTAPPPTNGFSA